MSETRTTSGRRSVRGVLLAALGAVVALAVAVFLGYEGLTGGPLFAGTGSSFTHDITTAKESVARSGGTPYSADQWILLIGGVLALVAFGAVLLSFSRRPGLSDAYATVALVVLIALSVVVLAIDILWAATGHPYSNYLPDDYPRSYVFPIAISGAAVVLFTVVLVIWERVARLVRRGRASRPRP